MVSVSLTGPPPVSRYGSVKSCSMPFTDRITAKISTCFNPGTVMAKNCRMRPAPSIEAASYRSSGIFCSPLNMITVLYPVHRHVMAMISTVFASHPKFSHCSPSPPSRRITLFTIPFS